MAASAGIRVGRTASRRAAARLSSPWLLRGASILFVLGLWEWAGRIPVNVAFPSCTETLAAFGEMLVDGTLAAAYAETAGPLIVGVLLTAVGGVLAGLVMGLSPRAEWLGLPMFIVLQASPSAAAQRARDRAQLLPRDRQHPALAR